MGLGVVGWWGWGSQHSRSGGHGVVGWGAQLSGAEGNGAVGLWGSAVGITREGAVITLPAPPQRSSPHSALRFPAPPRPPPFIPAPFIPAPPRFSPAPFSPAPPHSSPAHLLSPSSDWLLLPPISAEREFWPRLFRTRCALPEARDRAAHARCAYRKHVFGRRMRGAGTGVGWGRSASHGAVPPYPVGLPCASSPYRVGEPRVFPYNGAPPPHRGSQMPPPTP